MYTATLMLHSYFRWLVVLLGLWAVARALGGWGAQRLWTPADERAGRFFTIAFDVQFMLGLLLYVAISPITKAAFSDFGAAMRDSVLRFWAVEHITGMVVALAVAHIGRAKSRRLSDPTARHRAAAIYFGAAILILLVTMPWPSLAYGRPLLRF